MSAPSQKIAAVKSAKSFSLPWAVLPFLFIVGAMVILAIAAPLVAPVDPNTQNLLARLKSPGTVSRGVTYILGSDELGRDVLSRLIYGARVSLFVAFSSVILSGTIGSILGMVAAFYRGWVEIVIMRLVDIVLSVPAILFAIITVAVLGPGLINVVIVLALTRWPRYARVAYGQTLSVANMPYVRLSRFMGASWPRLLGRHILPNIAGSLVVVATLEFGLMVLFEAGLSFLGLGVQPPTASWGAMLSTGRNYVATAWWIATFPGLALFLLVLSINLIGDHVRDRLDPKAR
ncbi:peptide/nickel transport system permease protein [Rhizobium sp. NFR07]|uniref:ABC transporter permease n=1 Tax=Rhizobium sp. NFR07 TaxID=1566262 RepID=UPI0008F1FB20|nr:ABC transporter permease [Rhizobium sp. NFR07]SFB32173.1 peptide/nickel transport system permease protein [Rhizobium sp. NFR07]